MLKPRYKDGLIDPKIERKNVKLIKGNVRELFLWTKGKKELLIYQKHKSYIKNFVMWLH